MKKNLTIFLTVIISVFIIGIIVYADTNVFPTTLNDWDDGDIIESSWADAIEAKIGVSGSKVTTSLDYRTRINAELQGTASASYGLFSNTLQINGFSSQSYSRFGTNTTTSSFLSGANDLLITGNFEVDGSASFDGGLKGSGLTDCDTATTSKLLWDTTSGKFSCGTDTDTTGTASNSLNFDEFQNPLVLDTAITVASAGNTWNWDGTDFNDFGGASISGNLWLTKGQHIYGDMADTHIELNSTTGTHIGYGSGANHTHFVLTSGVFQWSTDGVGEIMRTTTTGLGIFDASPDVALDVVGAASISSNFEVGGYASASSYFGTAFGGIDCNDAGDQLLWSGGLFTCETLADADIPDALTIDTGSTLNTLSIGSGVTWTTTGTLTIGDNGDRVDFNTSGWDVANSVFSGLTGLTSTGVIDFGGATSLEIPNGNPTLDTLGEIGGKDASTSAFFGHFDGTTAKAIHDPCFTYYVESPTSTNQKWIGQKKFNDPFTITTVSPIASGTNAAGWNLIYGPAGSQTTKVFTLSKSASTSSYPDYISFANSTIGDKSVLSLVVASTSAVLKSFSVNVCGYYPR